MDLPTLLARIWIECARQLHIAAISIFVIISVVVNDETTATLAAFLIGCFSLCYLAKFTGDTMEDLTEYIPSRIAALLGAFLGNVPEIITNAIAVSKSLSYFTLIALVGGAVANGLILMGTCISSSENGFPRKLLEDKPAHVRNIQVFGITCSLACIPTIVQAATFTGSKHSWLETPTKATTATNYAVCAVLLLIYLYITWYQLNYSDSSADQSVVVDSQKDEADPETSAVASEMIDKDQPAVTPLPDTAGVKSVPSDVPRIVATNGLSDVFTYVSFAVGGVFGTKGEAKGGVEVDKQESDSLKTGRETVCEDPITSLEKGILVPTEDPDAVAVAVGQKSIGLDKDEGGDDEEEDDGPKDSRNVLILKLCFAVVGLALVSEVVTGAIDVMNQSGAIPTEFMVFAIIGIVGNVPEHYSALYMSWKKGDLSLAYGTAFGSSGQLIGLILPFLSLISGSTMPLLYNPKYLIMLQVSWVVPLLVVVFNLHSVTSGILMSAIYVVCAALSYVSL